MNEINSEMVSETDHLSVESQKGQLEAIESKIDQIYKDLEITEVPIEDLKIHPLNIELHGDNPRVEDLLISIPQYGLITPLLINPNREIIDGRRRYKALQYLHIDVVLCEIDPELADPDKVFERILIADQQKKKTPKYIYIASKRMKEIESERAKQRMSMGGKGSPLVDDLTGRADDNIARFFNIGRTTLRRIWKIYDKANDHPDIVKELNDGTLKVTAAWDKIIKTEDKEEVFQEHKKHFLNIIGHLERESLRTSLLAKYSHDRMIGKTSIEDLRKEIFRNLGTPIGETFQERWMDICEQLSDKIREVALSFNHYSIRRSFDGPRHYQHMTIWMDEAEGAQPLELETIKKSTFETYEEADAYAISKGGYCAGLGEYGGLPYWRLFIHPNFLEKKEEEDRK